MSNFITVPIAFFFQPVNCVHWLWQNLRQVTLAMLLNIAETPPSKKKVVHMKRAFLPQDMINKLCTVEPFLNTNYAQLMHPWSRKKVLHTNKSVFGSHQVNMGLCCWIRTHNDHGTQCKDRSFIFLDKLRQPWLFKKCIIGSLFLVGSCSRNSGFQQPSTNHMNIFIFAVWVLFDYGQDLPKACQNFKLCT